MKTEMSKAGGQQSTKTLSRVVDLLVEYRIKLDAREHVLKETNPLVHELYLRLHLAIQDPDEGSASPTDGALLAGPETLAQAPVQQLFMPNDEHEATGHDAI